MPKYNVYTSDCDNVTIDAPSWEIRADGTLIFTGEQTAAAFAPTRWQSVTPALASGVRIEVGTITVPVYTDGVNR